MAKVKSVFHFTNIEPLQLTHYPTQILILIQIPMRIMTGIFLKELKKISQGSQSESKGSPNKEKPSQLNMIQLSVVEEMPVAQWTLISQQVSLFHL